MDGGVRRTLSPALGVESSETGCIPWVRLESVVQCVSQTVCSASQDLVDDEGTFPFGIEFVLFLVRQTVCSAGQDLVANIVSFGPYFSALISSGLLLIKCGTGFCHVMRLLQGVQVVLPIELGFSFFVHAHSR